MQAALRKLYSWWMVVAVVAIFGVLYLNVLYPWMNRWGMTGNEAALSLPGNGAVDGVVATSTRGITIHAPADEVWQWVVQLGQERAGFYSNDWLENLVLADIHNVGWLLATLAVGFTLWFDLLQAPQKRLFSFENAAHAVAFEEYAAFHQLLLETILPETYPGRAR